MKKNIRKYAIYFVNLALFIALVLYSIKYSSVLIANFRRANLGLILAALVPQVMILYLASLKWNVFLRRFNSYVSQKKTFLAYNASGIYKYIPPKGINYIMRLSLIKQENLEGRIITIFGEFYAELCIGALAAAIFVMFYFSSEISIMILVFITMLLLFIVTIKPKIVLSLLNLFRLKLAKVRSIINGFSKLTRSPHYLYGLILTLITATLHGVSLYLINKSFGFNGLSLFTVILLFNSAYLLSVISLAPAGIGTRDISIIGLLMLLGYGLADATTVSLMSRVIILVPEIVIGLISLYLLKKK